MIVSLMTKHEQKIIERVAAIENGTFDEDSLKLLLIEIREHLKGTTILKEMCHFVAHSKRDTGICHRSVDVKYIKWKLLEDNLPALQRLMTEENRDKPESFFTDAWLGYINPLKIDKTIFELLILGGIDEVGDELLLEHYKLNKRQVKQFAVESYSLIDGYYVYNRISDIRRFVQLDDLLKFIRGTITGTPAIVHTDIINDFYKGIVNLTKKLHYKCDLQKIKSKKKDLVVAFLSLLHDSSFQLYDGNSARGFLSMHPDKDGPTLCLMSNTGGRLFIPLITTDIKAEDYIEFADGEMEQWIQQELPWNICKRDATGKLRLTKPIPM